MKKPHSEALNRFLANEERALAILAGVPTALVAVGAVIAMLAIVFMH